jgi:hypothetical protein
MSYINIPTLVSISTQAVRHTCERKRRMAKLEHRKAAAI